MGCATVHGDFNGDGLTDLAMTGLEIILESIHEGVNLSPDYKSYIVVYLNMKRGITEEPSQIIEHAVFGDYMSDRNYITSIDYNQDGYDDILACAKEKNQYLLYLYYGTNSGINQKFKIIDEPTCSLGTEVFKKNRNQVINIGDVNGDAYDDLLINRCLFFGKKNGFNNECDSCFGGDWNEEVISIYRENAGNSIIYTSNRNSINEFTVFNNQLENTNKWELDPALFEGYGEDSRMFASVGDFNGDKIPDFAIGCDSDVSSDELVTSRVMLFSLKKQGKLEKVDSLISLKNRHARIWYGFGFIGDLNGDGFGDLVLDGNEEKIGVIFGAKE